MMIDFALDAERARDLSPADAIYEACLLQFRPIMMTTMASLFGAVPLIIGMGEGSEFRQPLGITIIGGLVLQPDPDPLHHACSVSLSRPFPALEHADAAARTHRRKCAPINSIYGLDALVRHRSREGLVILPVSQ